MSAKLRAVSVSRRLVNAVACAAIPIFTVAVHDALTLHGLIVPRMESLRAAAAGVSVMALLTVSLAVPCALWIGVPALRRITAARRDAEAGNRLLMPVAGALVIGGATYLAALAAQTMLASARARRLFISLALVGTSWLALMARESVEARLRKALERGGPTTAIWATAAIVSAALVASLVIAWPILRQLEWTPIASVGLWFGAAFVGALLPRLAADAPAWKRFVARRLPAPLIALLVMLGGHGVWHAAAGLSNRMRLALKLTPVVSAWTLRKLQGGGVAGRPFETSAERTAVCREGAAPPALSAIEPLAGDAPDVVVIIVDALRWDHTSLSGYKRDTTPELARHATSAVVFERAYSLSSTTQESYRGLFTGVYGSKVHFVGGSELKWGMGFTKAQVTWAEMYRQAGFETYFTSPQHTIFSRADGALDGFDEVDESPVEQRYETDYTADYIVDLLLARLKRERTAPRFVWTHLMEPHQPYYAGPEPVHYGDDEPAKYDAAIHFMDEQLGRLLDHLLAPEQQGRTWVVIGADHGQALREHGNRHHGSTVYEEEIHVPLLIWGPGVKPRRIATPVSLIDLMPTALDVVGMAVPDALCGESLKPALEGEELSPRIVYAENTPDEVRAIFSVAMIDGSYKSILSPIDQVRELYDLQSDPAEKNNLAQTDPALLERQLSKLRAFHGELGLRSSQYGL